MKRFKHKNIIKKYSKLFEISRNEFDGTIVNGKPVYNEVKFNLLMAFKNIKETELQEGSGFIKGDAKVYAIKNQIDSPENGDKFFLNGKEFKLVDPNDNDLYPDYHYFIARRVVKDV